MSLDLFKEDIGNRMASFTTIRAPEPGIWEGYLRGTGMIAMRELAKAGRAVDLLGAIGPMAQDALGFGVERGGTTAQDRYFREHDETFNSAVDYWTPRPGEVGAAAEITGTLLTLLPMVVASPAFAAGSSVLMTGEELVREGVRGEQAAVAGGLMGAGLATGIWMPILGQNLWQRMLIGGAAFNVLQGAATRGAIGTFLESGDATEAEKKAAQGFKAFDPVELTTDVLLGLAFGSFVHLNPRARAEGAEAWKRIGDWAQALNPSDKAAVAVLREAQHLNKDSFPGTPVGAEDVNAHVERMRRAIDQAERGQPIAVDDLPAPRAEPDTQRNAEAQARMAEMLVEAEAIREAEGLPPAPLPDLPPARPVLERTPEGAPRLVTDRVVLDEPRPFQTVGNEAYYEATVRSPEGNPLGVVALGWRGDEVVELLNIQAIDQNRGMGAAVLSGILRNNAPDTEVWIRLIQPEARGFWEKVGARLFDTEEGTDGAITKAEFDTARANRAAEEEAGRAGAADAGTGARTDTAQQGRAEEVALGQPVDVVSQRGETSSVTYERLPDGRLQRTIRYNDGESFVESLHTDKKGDEQWVSNEQYQRGEYYPVRMSDEAARAKAAEDLADLGTPARQPAEQAQAAAATEPPRTRIEIPADLMAADPETQARAIGQSIEDRLLELGVEPEEARANGAIWEAFFRTLAQKYGVNPGETLASYGIDIRRLDTIADLPGALAQATTPNQGKPLVVYHGTSLKNLAGILKNGLVPKKKKNHKESGDYVYVELSARTARAWARQAGGREFAVLEIEVPKGELTPDSQTLSRTSFRTKRIPKSRIKGWDVYQINPETGDLEYVRSESNPAFRPEQVKSATGNAGTFDPANPSILRQTATPSQSWYYSALGQAIEKANMNAAPAKGWKDMLKGLIQKGVKPDEIKWSGIEEWLDLQQGRVTKEAVLDYLRNNGVRVEEVVLGQYANDYEAFVARMEQKYGEGYQTDVLTDAERAEQSRLWEMSNRTGGMRALDTKYSQYQLPGALPGTYRELLLTLPPKDLSAQEAEMPAGYGLARMQDGGWAYTRPADTAGIPIRDLPPNATRAEAVAAARREIERTWQMIGMGEPATRFQSSHFQQPDILAHVRFNERTDADGQRVLFLEEIQSDWAQAGKRSGFASPDAAERMDKLVKQYDALAAERRTALAEAAALPGDGGEQFIALTARVEQINEQLDALDGEMTSLRLSQRNLIPAAPFVEKTEQWVALVLKRMIRYAAENGINRIAWTRGEQQVDRYTRALRKAVDTIEWTKTDKGVQLVGYKNTDKVVDTTEREDALSDSIGKALAKQILDDPNQSGTITGDNIRIDDTGMAQFYDRIVPNVAKDVLKKLGGGKVTDASIDVQGRPDSQPSIDLPPEMLDKALQGQTLFQRGGDARQTEAVGNAVKAAQRWETERIDALRQTLFDELADQGTVQGRVVDMEGLPRDEAGDLTPEGEAEASRRERAAIDAAAETAPRIATLDDVDSYGTPTQARDAAKAYLDSIGAAYSEDGGWGTSLYIEVRPPEGSAAEDEGLTLKLRFSNHENQSRMHTPTEHNWVEGSVPSGMLQAMLDAARRFAETGEGGDLFFQTGAPYTQPERGVIHFGNGQTMIGLMATANRSTFLHESGHLFLQITRDVVQSPEIPAQARADWERLSAWLGIEPDTATIPVEAHEKFTRGFEAYLREGKAPNQGLQDVFRRFRDWLLDIYHSVADLRVELSDDVRGIMARMLDSQARDPINAKGPAESAPRVSPPPPPGEGGEATPRPEAPPTPEGARTPGALEGPDPWDVEGSIPAQGPDVPFEPVGLDNPDMRTMLQIMADEEAGWLEIGGRLDRSRLTDPEKLGTPAFTKWVPKADWWPQREGKLNEAQTREAVRRALAGEKLTKKQQAAIDYMMDVANQRLHAEKVLGSDEFGAIARDLVDEGLDPTTQDINEVAMIARAAEIDEARVERAAMIHEGNHDAFLEEIRTILDEAAEREAGAPPAEPAGRPGQEGAGAQGREGGGEGRPDPVAAAAQRFVDQNPGRTIQVVDDAGNTRTMTAAEYLQMARAEAERAREDVGLFQAAAECLLGGGR